MAADSDADTTTSMPVVTDADVNEGIKKIADAAKNIIGIVNDAARQR